MTTSVKLAYQELNFTGTASNNIYYIQLLTFSYGTFYSDDPLWDGAGCTAGDSCCEKGQYFVKTFNETTTSDIELRLCGNEDRYNEDTPIEVIELYVQ